MTNNNNNTAGKLYVRTIANDAAKALNLQILAGVEYAQVGKRDRKNWCESVVTSTATTMTEESLGKRMREVVAMLDKFGGDVSALEAAIDQFNSQRHAKGGVYTYSSQFLHSWLVNGKIHGSDTVGRRVFEVKPEPQEGKSTESTESTPEIKGDPVASIASILQGIDSVDDLVLVAHMVEARRDALAAATVTV